VSSAAVSTAFRPGVLADLIPGARVRDSALVVGGAGLTGLAAQVAIATPLTPVPFTLQTMAVLVVGAALGSVRGMASMALYVAAGSAGVPWFSEHRSGWAFGPSFGYIVGFIAAAGIVGYLASRGADRAVRTTVLLMALGNAVLLSIGTLWLAAELEVPLARAFELGVQPFLLGDALKLAVAALAFPAAWKLARRN
jgi:biotin transport system substrate-specific component